MHRWLASRPTAVVLLWLLTAVSYGGQLANGFCLDDVALLFDNRFVLQASWGDMWSASYWHGVTGEAGGLYRPVLLTLAASARILFGTDPAYYHLGGLMLHALAGTCLLLASRGLGTPPTAAWLGSALFCVHPAASEVVCSVVGTADLLAFICGLAGAVWLLQARTVPLVLLAAGALAFAALCKEGAAVFSASALAALMLRQRRPLAIAAAVAALVAPVVVRAFVTAQIGAGATGFLDNPLAFAEITIRWLNAPAMALRYLLLLVFPWPLSADYSYDAIPVLAAADVTSWLPALLLCLSLLWWLWRLLQHQQLLWGLIAVGTVVLATHVVVPLGTVFAERLAYPMLAAVAVGAGSLLQRLCRHWPTMGKVVCICVILVLVVQTRTRVVDWRDNGSLFASAVQVRGNSARAHYGLGRWLQQQDQPQEAVYAYEQALRIYPRYSDALYNRGAAMVSMGHERQALASFEQAAASRPAYVQALFAVAALKESLGRIDALSAYRVVLQHEPAHEQALLGVARCTPGGAASPQ